MVKICQTVLLKLNFEIIPKKRIFRFLQKISAGHGWSWKIFFANFQILGPLGCQVPQNVKKVKITAPYCRCSQWRRRGSKWSREGTADEWSQNCITLIRNRIRIRIKVKSWSGSASKLRDLSYIPPPPHMFDSELVVPSGDTKLGRCSFNDCSLSGSPIDKR